VKVSVVIDTGRAWSAVRELAHQVADQGVYTVFVPDHFMETVEAALVSSLSETPGGAGLQP
jgi:hypothetical protein